jgi:hypothetical protein
MEDGRSPLNLLSLLVPKISPPILRGIDFYLDWIQTGMGANRAPVEPESHILREPAERLPRRGKGMGVNEAPVEP